jgi:hypothetical protein
LRNIKLYDEGGELDYSTAAGQAFFGMKSIFASFERAMIKDRMYAGKLYHFKQGSNWGGPLPLGIKRQGKKLVEDKVGMKVINDIFKFIDQGWSIKQIERWTIANNIKPALPRERGGMSEICIKKILTNSFYATGEHVMTTAKEGKIAQKIELSNAVPLELFDRVQSTIKSRTPGRPAKGTYLLSGLVYPVLPLGEGFTTDEYTGETVSDGEDRGVNKRIRFRSITRNGIRYYYCKEWGDLRRGKKRFFKSHGQRRDKIYASIPKDMLEDIVWDALEKMAADPKILINSIDRQSAVIEAEKEILEGLVKTKERHIKRIETALDRYYNVFGQTGDSYDYNKIQATKKELQQERNELTEIKRKLDSTGISFADVTNLLDAFSVIHDLRINGSVEAQLAFIQKYVSCVEIDHLDKIEIWGRFEISGNTKGVHPRWSKGRVIWSNLKGPNYNNDLKLIATTHAKCR